MSSGNLRELARKSGAQSGRRSRAHVEIAQARSTVSACLDSLGRAAPTRPGCAHKRRPTWRPGGSRDDHRRRRDRHAPRAASPRLACQSRVFAAECPPQTGQLLRPPEGGGSFVRRLRSGRAGLARSRRISFAANKCPLLDKCEQMLLVGAGQWEICGAGAFAFVFKSTRRPPRPPRARRTSAQKCLGAKLSKCRPW